MFVRLLLGLVAGFIVLNSVQSIEVIFDRIEMLNSSYVEGYYNISLLRVTKFNRTTFVLNAEFELFVDVTDKFMVEADFHYNRFNNNQYNKLPGNVKKDTICKHAEKYYKKMIMADVEHKSNFPQYAENEQVCPIKKVIRRSIDSEN